MPPTTLAGNRRLDTTWDFRPGAEQILRTVQGADAGPHSGWRARIACNAIVRLGVAPATGYHGGRRIRDLVEWSLQASIEAPAPTAPRPRTVRRLSVPSRTSGTLPSHRCPGAGATELPVCAPAM